MKSILFMLILVNLAQAKPQFKIVQQSEIFDEAYFKALEDDETPNFYEGDIIKPPKSEGENSALASWSSKWPNGKVPVVYSSSFSESQKQKILEAMKEIEEKTCIRFPDLTEKELKDGADYVGIIKAESSWDCSSFAGKKGGYQALRLGNKCFTEKKIILHELMHAIGFVHEHTRPDRDNYVTIIEDNIDPSKKNNFEKHKAGELTYLNTEYAYESIMHYHSTAFALNPDQPTIIAKDKSALLGGEGDRLSDIDVLRIKRYYKCGSDTTSLTWSKRNVDVLMAHNCDILKNTYQTTHGTPESCTLQCVGDVLCMQFTWKPKEGGTCYLMNYYDPYKVFATPENSQTVCGVKVKEIVIRRPDPPKLTLNWKKRSDGLYWAKNCDMPGDDFRVRHGSHPLCAERCIDEDKCTHFVWNPSDGGTCYLKHGYEPSNVFATAESWKTVCGVKVKEVADRSGGPPTLSVTWQHRNFGIHVAHNCDVPGHNIHDAPTHGDSESCVEQCYNEPECDHFAWKPDSGGSCWLKKDYDASRLSVTDEKLKTVCGVKVASG